MKKLLFTLIAAVSATQGFAQHSDSKTANSPTKKPFNKLEEIIVTANRIETPLRQIGSSVSILDIENIQARGQNNIADVLRTSPGIAVSNSGGAGKDTTLRIRGEEGYRTLILVDGVKMTDPTGTQATSQIQQIGSDNIERVEILRGPQGMMYGADAGGVVNIITRRPTTAFEGNLNAETGRYDSNRLSGNIGGKLDKFDYGLLLSNYDSNGFNAEKSDSSRDKDGYNNATAAAKAGVELLDNLRLDVNTRNVDSESKYDSCGDYFNPSNDCREDYLQRNQRAALSNQIGDFDQQLAFNRSEIDRDTYADGIRQYGFDGSVDEVQYSATMPIGNVGKIIGGADLEQQTDDGNKTERDQLGTYVEWQGTASEALSYSAGFRHDDNDDFGTHNSYRTSVAYIIATEMCDEIKLRGSYGTGFRAPSLYEININNNSPLSPSSLKEETSAGVDVGVDFYWTNGAIFEATYFNQNVEDKIDWFTADFVTYEGYYTQADGISNSKGVELAATIPLSKNWNLISNYTYNDTEDGNGERRLRRPRHVANLGLAFTSDNQKLTADMNLRTSQDAIDFGGTELDDYEVLDFTVSYQLIDDIKVYVRGENAFDTHYTEVTGYNTSGAAFYSGVRYTF